MALGNNPLNIKTIAGRGSEKGRAGTLVHRLNAIS